MGTLGEAASVAEQYGVPVGWGESGVQFLLPGVASIPGRRFSTDQEASIWLKKVFAWYDARPSHLGFLWQQPDSNAKPTGTTYLPDPVRHPKTWAVLQERFPG